jgi:hypothetical protein
MRSIREPSNPSETISDIGGHLGKYQVKRPAAGAMDKATRLLAT